MCVPKSGSAKWNTLETILIALLLSDDMILKKLNKSWSYLPIQSGTRWRQPRLLCFFLSLPDKSENNKELHSLFQTLQEDKPLRHRFIPFCKLYLLFPPLSDSEKVGRAANSILNHTNQITYIQIHGYPKRS